MHSAIRSKPRRGPCPCPVLTDPSMFAGMTAEIKAQRFSKPRALHEERLILMNKRDTMLSLIHDTASPEYIPAAFFLHFDSAYHQGQAAIEKHLEFFRATGMDFVKSQYEQGVPAAPSILRAAEWAHAPRCDE